MAIIISENEKIKMAYDLLLNHGINRSYAVELAPKMMISEQNLDKITHGFNKASTGYAVVNTSKIVLECNLGVEFPFIKLICEIKYKTINLMKGMGYDMKNSESSSINIVVDDEIYQNCCEEYASENVKNLRKMIINVIEGINENMIGGKSIKEYLDFLVKLLRHADNLAKRNEIVFPRNFMKGNAIMLKSLLLKANVEADDEIALTPKKCDKKEPEIVKPVEDNLIDLNFGIVDDTKSLMPEKSEFNLENLTGY